MTLRVAVLAAAVALSLAGGAVAQPPAGPMVRVEGLRPVSAHVQVIPDADTTPGVPNVGLIVGTKGVLVVDTGLGPPNGAAVAAVAERVAPGRAIWLVATHAHPEHDMGAQAFPAGTKLIRSEDQARDGDNDRAVAKLFAARSPVMAELLKGAMFRPADVTFKDDYRLDLGGGVTVRLIALGPNHTDGDTAIWVPADRVLFSGDVAMKAQPALMTPATSIAHWMATLDRLDALKPLIVVPSHGPVGDAAFIAGYRAYLKEVAERTQAARTAGKSLEETTAAVVAAMGARYPDRGRLTGAVRVAYGGAAR